MSQRRHLMQVAVLGLLLLSLAPSPSAGQTPPPQSPQDEQRLELELGQFYEEQGACDDARRHYEAVLAGPDPSLAEKAWQGLERCVVKQDKLWAGLRDEFRFWLVVGVRFLAIAVFALLLYLGLRAYRRRQRSGYLLLAFDDYTGRGMGPMLARSLRATLTGIVDLHREQADKPLIQSEEFDLPTFGTLDESDLLSPELLRFVESITIGIVEMPLEGLVRVLKSWLRPASYRLSGRLEPTEDGLRMTVSRSDGETGKEIDVWRERAVGTGGATLAELQQRLAHRRLYDTGGATLAELQQRLAHRILYDTCRATLRASSWKSLQLFSRGLEHMRAYGENPLDRDPLSKAVKDLEETIALDPGYIPAQYSLALTYHHLEQYQKAIQLLQNLPKRSDGSVDPEIVYNLGIARYYSLEDLTYESAKREFWKVVDSIPPDERSKRRRGLLALAHCGLTSVCAQQLYTSRVMRRSTGDRVKLYYEANGHYNKAQKLARESPEIEAIAHTAMGQLLVNNGQVLKAISKFEAAARLQPDNWRLHLHWGQAELARGEYVLATHCLRRALGLNPGNEFTHYQLGVALRRAGAFDKALEAFARAPGIAQAHDGRGSILAEHYQDYEAAMKEFEQALALESGSANAMANIAWYTLEAGHKDAEHLNKALLYAKRAVKHEKRKKNMWHRHCILGRVYLQLGRPEDAKKELEEALNLDTDQPQTYFYLARLHLRQGELEEASKYLDEFLARPRSTQWYERNKKIANSIKKELDRKLATGN